MSNVKPTPNDQKIVASMSMAGFQKLGNGDGENIRWTCDPSVELPVKLARDPNHPGSLAPTTVISVFKETVRTKPKLPAMRVERDGVWKEWNFATYYKTCCAFAKSLIKIGFMPHECINIIGFNSPEWFMADIGAIFAGGIAAGIYTTNGPDACHYVAEHSEARVLVVEDDLQLQKILQIRDRLPKLIAIVQYIGNPPRMDGVYSWGNFLSLGAEVSDAALDERMNNQKPGNCCTLIYTSGTTGNPKAVMLSHDNITWTAQMANLSFTITDKERLISYLPLSHIAAQLTELHAPLKLGACVYFARPDALKGTLVQTLQAVRPTIFFGVPRVWEKIEEKMRAVGAANTGVKKMMGDWAKGVGLKGNLAKLDGKEVPWGFTLADKLVFHNVKKALGLDEARILMTGAAPIAQKTLNYFLSLNMPVRELYGMSESTGPGTWNREGETKVGSVGKCMMGAEVAIGSPNGKGIGEILMRGRHVFMGYMKNPDATRKDIDEMGYLHSGDLGRVDKDGFLYITGRIKELIITAGGENIPPVLIEDALKAECDIISYAVLIGDKRKYLTMMLTIKNEPDANGLPTDKLSDPALAYAKMAGSSATTVSQCVNDAKIRAAIQKAINKVNEAATSRAQRIQKFVILPTDFSLETGELTPTVKLKRAVVAEKFSDVIEGMYGQLPSKM